MDQPQRITSIDLITNDTTFNFKDQFDTFLKEFTINDKHIYSTITDHLTIFLEHMNSFNPTLYSEFLKNPEEIKQKVDEYLSTKEEKKIFTNFHTSQQLTNFRNLDSSRLYKIVKVRGIVTSVSSTFVKPVKLYISCRICMATKFCTTIPRNCTPECGLDPFMVIPEKCEVVDAQTAKLQEPFEDVPTGEVPKHTQVMMEGNLTNVLVAGQTVEVTGILKINGLKSIGILQKKKNSKNFSEFEISNFLGAKNSRKDFYDFFASSIAPQIQGMEDVKKAILLQLLGGVSKVNVTKTRGFINILLMGDPGVAKSQILKAVAKIAPVSVYTSGKGASAAGLTATVIRNKHGQFVLEGGALVLADTGVCCIDEFDKMGYDDRVAIHEAMEQGTISVAKAGITTMLNTRTSILAAANPVYGRYNSLKSITENVEMETTILSRFDAIFILKDVINSKKDEKLARHVLQLHQNKNDTDYDGEMVHNAISKSGNEISEKNFLELDFMRRYIQYAKEISPTLNSRSKNMLKSFYLEMRAITSPIPITVRQLEAVIRMSEARAKLFLRTEVNEDDVKEAIRIFRNSTLKAAKEGLNVEGMNREEVVEEINGTIDAINKIMNVNTAKNIEKLIIKVAESNSCDDAEKYRGRVTRALGVLAQQEKYVMKDDGRVVVRIN